MRKLVVIAALCAALPLAAQEQPADKDRAQKATKTEPGGHMPPQPDKKDDELQPLREKSGF